MKGCKQMCHFLNSSNYRDALIQPLKVNSPKTKKPPAARGAQKCLRVIYPCCEHIRRTPYESPTLNYTKQ